jgi:hypothetical protein
MVGPQSRELAAKLAEHFIRGRDPRRAVQYLQYAGENALRQSAHQEAIAHLHQGMALLSTLPETPERTQQELTFQMTLDAVLENVKGASDLRRDRGLAGPESRAIGQGRLPRWVPLVLALAASDNIQGQFQTARGLAEQALLLVQCVWNAMYLA